MPTTKPRNRPHREVRIAVARRLELRTADDGTLTLDGYATVFDSPSEGLPFVERIMPGAFTDSLAGDPDVRLLYNHDPDSVMARTSAGTLELDQDDIGLHFVAQLDPTDTDVIRLAPKVRSGHVNQMSFAFWVPEGGSELVNVDGIVERHVRTADINDGDVSAVTYPAYPTTTVQLRALGAAAQLASLSRDRKSARQAFEQLEELPDGVDFGPVRALLDRAEQRAAVELTHADLAVRIDDALEDGPLDDLMASWWICDVAASWVVVRIYPWYEETLIEEGWFQYPYTVDDSGTVTLGDPVEVLPRTSYDPAPPEPEEDEPSPATGPETASSRSTGDTHSTMSIDEARTQAHMRRRH